MHVRRSVERKRREKRLAVETAAKLAGPCVAEATSLLLPRGGGCLERHVWLLSCGRPGGRFGGT